MRCDPVLELARLDPSPLEACHAAYTGFSLRIVGFRGVERRIRPLQVGAHVNLGGKAQRGRIGGSALVIRRLAVLLFMVRLLVEAENDVGAVDIVHNGEMTPALQLLQRAIGYFSRLGVVKNGDGLCGKSNLRYRLQRRR